MSDFAFTKDQLGDRSFILAGNKSHLFQFVDSGFRTKWTGFWVPPFKYFDYYVFHLNGSWLDAGNAVKFEYSPGKALRHYNLNNLDIAETIFVPDNQTSMVSILTIRNTSDKIQEINLDLTLGQNIRTKNENWHTRGYDLSYDDIRNSVVMSEPETSAFFIFGIGNIDKSLMKSLDIMFTKKCEYHDHYPGGEKQRVMDPGCYKIKYTLGPKESVTLPFIFTGSHISKNHLYENHDTVINDWKNLLDDKSVVYDNICACTTMDCPEPEISKAFSCSAVCLKDLVHESDYGTGMYAGFPWFLDFWGRDTFWSLLGLTDAGDFETVKKILICYLRSYNDKSGLPTLISMENERKYYSDDIDPLFLIASNYYVQMSADHTFARKIQPIAKRMIKKIKTENKMIKTSPDGTWMDSYKRHGNAIDIQSLWVEALKPYNKDKSEQLKTIVEIIYWNNNTRYFYDTYGSSKDPTKTINVAVSLMFNQISPFKTKRTLDVIRDEFATPFGARTRGMNELDYHAEAYHKGSCWGLTTGWTACAFFRHFYIKEGLDMLRSMAGYLDKDTIGALPETLSAYDGRNLAATMQTWSSAMYIHAIDRYMFGIEPDEFLITITPRIPSEWDKVSRRSKRIRDNYMDLSIEQDSHKYNLSIKFRKTPDFRIKIILPGRINAIKYNEKVIKDNTITTKAKKEMLFEGTIN